MITWIFFQSWIWSIFLFISSFTIRWIHFFLWTICSILSKLHYIIRNKDDYMMFPQQKKTNNTYQSNTIILFLLKYLLEKKPNKTNKWSHLRYNSCWIFESGNFFVCFVSSHEFCFVFCHYFKYKHSLLIAKHHLYYYPLILTRFTFFILLIHQIKNNWNKSNQIN